jgi:hypothetical protein
MGFSVFLILRSGLSAASRRMRSEAVKTCDIGASRFEMRLRAPHHEDLDGTSSTWGNAAWLA